MLHTFWLLRRKSLFLVTYVFLTSFSSYFCEQETRCCSDDAPRTGKRNVNSNKNKSENAALNKIKSIFLSSLTIPTSLLLCCNCDTC